MTDRPSSRPSDTVVGVLAFSALIVLGWLGHETTESSNRALASEAARSPSPDDTWAELLAGNARFVAGRPRVRDIARRRGELRSGQHPGAIVLGCADSRCPPELLFDQGLGDLFVVRTAGNVADPVALGSIEYAVAHLNVPLLIVLGHTSCGAVSATLAGVELASPNLRAIVSHIRPALLGGESLPDLGRAVHLSTKRSAADVLAASQVLRDHTADGRLKILAAVYDLGTGEVKRLD